MKTDWKKKLTSRKFWGAVVGFITPLLVAYGASDSEIAQATSIIMSGGVLIAYIIGEGMVDKAAVESKEEQDDEICSETGKA